MLGNITYDFKQQVVSGSCAIYIHHRKVGMRLLSSLRLLHRCVYMLHNELYTEAATCRVFLQKHLLYKL